MLGQVCGTGWQTRRWQRAGCTSAALSTTALSVARAAMVWTWSSASAAPQPTTPAACLSTSTAWGPPSRSGPRSSLGDFLYSHHREPVVWRVLSPSGDFLDNMGLISMFRMCQRLLLLTPCRGFLSFTTSGSHNIKLCSQR